MGGCLLGGGLGHGEGPEEFLICMDDYPPLLEIGEVTVDSWARSPDIGS
jgi:hypothetical protein